MGDARTRNGLIEPEVMEDTTPMIDAINTKVLDLLIRARAALSSERGQTSAEYTAVTVVGVSLAILVVWVTLGDAIDKAITSIADDLTTFADKPPLS
jgi:Flp pilus assembly pilin Flp